MNRRMLVLTLLLAVVFSPALQAQLQQRIESEVRHELLMLPYYGVFDWITFRVQGSKVTLHGQVSRPTLKKDCERAVTKIESVESVVNEIEVLPTSPNDDRIRSAVLRAVYGFASLQRYARGSRAPIHIIVKNGNVTLEGIVDSEADKNVAGLQANGVSGVFGVTNNLVVEKRQVTAPGRDSRRCPSPLSTRHQSLPGD